MKMTPNPPKGEGYFWFCNFCEHTPTILKVERSCGRLYADNGEYNFIVDKQPDVRTEKEYDDEEPSVTIDGIDYYSGSCFWSSCIELPEINGEFILPDSY